VLSQYPKATHPLPLTHFEVVFRNETQTRYSTITSTTASLHNQNNLNTTSSPHVCCQFTATWHHVSADDATSATFCRLQTNTQTNNTMRQPWLTCTAYTT